MSMMALAFLIVANGFTSAAKEHTALAEELSSSGSTIEELIAARVASTDSLAHLELSEALSRAGLMLNLFAVIVVVVSIVLARLHAQVLRSTDDQIRLLEPLDLQMLPPPLPHEVTAALDQERRHREDRRHSSRNQGIAIAGIAVPALVVPLGLPGAVIVGEESPAASLRDQAVGEW
ncbi:MAG: hypothetical protein WKF58_05280 [Ilumatobacteraceae bacterium]